jgi:hypothetical protein
MWHILNDIKSNFVHVFSTYQVFYSVMYLLSCINDNHVLSIFSGLPRPMYGIPPPGQLHPLYQELAQW